MDKSTRNDKDDDEILKAKRTDGVGDKPYISVFH